LHVEHPDVVAAHFAGHACAAENVDRQPDDPVADRPMRARRRIDLLRRAELKDRRVLEKNGRFSGKNRSNRVRSPAPRRLHLREIGVHREVA